MRLALFDLDHTLLSGDSDQLWCDFLITCGLLPADIRESAAEVAIRYAAGTIAPSEYCGFFASIMSGYDMAQLGPLQRRFFKEVVHGRIPAGSRALLAQHRQAGDVLILTTATNRVVSELTARHLQVDHYLCTELEIMA